MKKIILSLTIAFVSASAFAQGIVIVSNQGGQENDYHHGKEHKDKNKDKNKDKHEKKNKHDKHNKGPSENASHKAHEAYGKNHPNYHNHANDPYHTHGYVAPEQNGIVIDNNGIRIPGITIR